jgi:hypothetical protein
MRVRCLFGLAVVAGAAASANALTFQCRWVERVGTTDVVIGGDGATIDAGNGNLRQIRLQFGVFDDATGAAPAGGFVGWNVGSLTVSGPSANSDERRSGPAPGGRLSPFNFAAQPTANGNPPLPGGDPFDALTEIDATLGTQSPPWLCDAQGNVPPQPNAAVRGRNAFVSVYQISIDPAAGFTGYSITVGGNLIAATEWRTVGTPQPPECGDPLDPSDDIPGQVTYAPFPTDPLAIHCTLFVAPAPGAAALLGLGGLLAIRRRR